MSTTAFDCSLIEDNDATVLVPAVPYGHGCGMVATLSFDGPLSDYVVRAVQKNGAYVRADHP
jgi:hypothetical protein